MKNTSNKCTKDVKITHHPIKNTSAQKRIFSFSPTKHLEKNTFLSSLCWWDFFLHLQEVLELKALELGGQLVPLLVEAEVLSLLTRDVFSSRHGFLEEDG